MTVNDSGQLIRPPGSRHSRPAVWMALTVVALIAGTTWFYFFYYPGTIEPTQPIPFSHRVHAGDKEIGCLVCHEGAISGRRAGVPPLETCMLCHKRVIVTHPEIQRLRQFYDEHEPVEWLQVYDVPEFVYFNHEAHVRRQVDCGQCHGDVKGMDRVVQVHEFNMGYCVQCHRDNQVSHDCLKCHR